MCGCAQSVWPRSCCRTLWLFHILAVVNTVANTHVQVFCSMNWIMVPQFWKPVLPACHGACLLWSSLVPLCCCCCCMSVSPGFCVGPSSLFSMSYMFPAGSHSLPGPQSSSPWCALNLHVHCRSFFWTLDPCVHFPSWISPAGSCGQHPREEGHPVLGTVSHAEGKVFLCFFHTYMSTKTFLSYFLWCRLFQPQPCWHFGSGNFSLWEATCVL